MTAPDIPCIRHLTVKAVEDCTCTGQLPSMSVCNCVNVKKGAAAKKAYVLT